MEEQSASPDATRWLAALRRYAVLIFLTNLVWEVAQLPLYTLWRQGTWGEIAFALAHCTAGDVAIALAALVSALMLGGAGEWPRAGFARSLGAATALGIGYTVYSEWLNTSLRLAWTYSELMPVVPVLGTGLAPLLQWVLLPPLCLLLARGGAGARA